MREGLALLCEAEVAHREERRIQMGTSIAKFPFVRTLEGLGLSEIPCLGPYDAAEGAIVCRDANRLRSPMSCSTSS